jgi:hypothetical protein
MVWHIDIEPQFGEFVKCFGGQLVADIVGQSPSFANADYLFRAENVVAELKTLTEDKSHDEATQKKFGALFRSWIARKLIPPQPIPSAIYSRDYPMICQKEMYDVWARPVKKHLAKANRQIRETKTQLGLHSAKGLVIVANDGNWAVPPPVLLHILFKSIKSDFHSIDSFVLLTVNMFSSSTRIGNAPVLVWLQGTRDETSFPNEFGDRLGDGWRRFVEMRTGVGIAALNDPDLGTIASLQFAKPSNRQRI